ncbi:MAG: zinc-ribbon domain-containing protein [Nitrospirae bacterium]|nr:zinc-ribbon domain-containing protein [Nitrospirota bacterium]
MKITCPNCKKNLVIADDKLPDKDEFKITCPQCGEKLTVDRKNTGSNAETGSLGADDFEEGARPVLVCESDSEIQRQLVKALSELGYTPVVPKNMDEAFEKIRFTRFEVIVLNELFDGSKAESNDLFDHFGRMPMIDRRHIFLALTGSGFTSMDNGTAFSKSVNVVINLKDTQNFKNILKKSIADNDQFYRVYKGILKELGKV